MTNSPPVLRLPDDIESSTDPSQPLVWSHRAANSAQSQAPFQIRTSISDAARCFNVNRRDSVNSPPGNLKPNGNLNSTAASHSAGRPAAWTQKLRKSTGFESEELGLCLQQEVDYDGRDDHIRTYNSDLNQVNVNTRTSDANDVRRGSINTPGLNEAAYGRNSSLSPRSNFRFLGAEKKKSQDSPAKQDLIGPGFQILENRRPSPNGLLENRRSFVQNNRISSGGFNNVTRENTRRSTRDNDVLNANYNTSNPSGGSTNNNNLTVQVGPGNSGPGARNSDHFNVGLTMKPSSQRGLRTVVEPRVGVDARTVISSHADVCYNEAELQYYGNNNLNSQDINTNNSNLAASDNQITNTTNSNLNTNNLNTNFNLSTEQYHYESKFSPVKLKTNSHVRHPLTGLRPGQVVVGKGALSSPRRTSSPNRPENAAKEAHARKIAILLKSRDRTSRVLA